MDGANVACELKVKRGSVEFSVATPEDDAEIRQLLRENPMRGAISISLEREPSYFAGCSLGKARDITIVARKNGRLVCLGSCSIRRRFVNGEARPVGYLGGLRLDRSVEGRFDILRMGYRFFEEIVREEEAEVYFTSIAADNFRARQFLEANLRGIPKYEFVGEFVTFIMPTKRHGMMVPITVTHEINEDLFNQKNYQFASEWDAGELKGLVSLGCGPAIEVNCSGERCCGVVWNQQCFKQSVVRGYSSGTKLARPIMNALARFGGVRLPRAGEVLNLAFLSPICATEQTIARLVQAALEVACQRGIELLALGLDKRDPMLPRIMKAFRGRQYRSRIYVVRWDGDALPKLDEGRLMRPEVALL